MEREKIIKITNVKQFECLVECMEKNVEIARGYYNFGSSKMEFTNAWNGFAEKLNCLGPPVRDGSGWQKVWTDFKGKLKKKLGHNKKEISATGGGACRLNTFSPLEESVIKILSLERIFPKTLNKSYGLPPVASTSSGNSSESLTLPSVSTSTTDNDSQNDLLATVPVSDNSDREQGLDYTAPTANKRPEHPKKNQKDERLRLLEVQTKSIMETEKSVKESARYARKLFELKQKKFDIWRQHLLHKQKHDKENITLKIRQLEYELSLKRLRKSRISQ